MTTFESQSIPLTNEAHEEVDAWAAFGDLMTEHVSGDYNAFIVVDNSQEGFPIVFASPAMCRLMGTPDLVGQPLDIFCGELTDEDDLALLRDALSGQTMKSCCIASYNVEGNMFWNHVVMQPGLPLELPFSYIACHDVSHIFDSIEENSRIQDHPEATKIHIAQVQNGHMALNMVRMMVYGEDDSAAEASTSVTEQQAASPPLVQMDFDELSADLLVSEVPVEEVLPAEESAVLSPSPREKVAEVEEASVASAVVTSSV